MKYLVENITDQIFRIAAWPTEGELRRKTVRSQIVLGEC
jgi:hypothetical protein